MYQSCDVHSVYDQYEIDGVFKSCFIFLSNNSNALTVVSECVCMCMKCVDSECSHHERLLNLTGSECSCAFPRLMSRW